MASTYSARARELADCRVGLAILETEVCFLARPLGEALESVSRQSRGVARCHFREASRHLLNGAPAAVAWTAAVHDAAGRSSLSEADAGVLLGLGPVLGNSPVDEQRRHIRGVAERLGVQEADARDRQSREGRLWGYAGLLSGLALAAILL